MNCDVGCRHGLDLGIAVTVGRLVATALSQPLAWEPPYAAGVALKRKKEKKKKKERKKKCFCREFSGLWRPLLWACVHGFMLPNALLVRRTERARVSSSMGGDRALYLGSLAETSETQPVSSGSKQLQYCGL